MGKELGANVGVVARRRELIHRLEDASQHPAKEVMLPHVTAKGSNLRVQLDKVECFDVHYAEGHMATYEWWPPNMAQEQGLVDNSAKPLQDDDRQKDLEIKAQTLREMLEKNDIDTSEFGKGAAKTLDDL